MLLKNEKGEVTLRPLTEGELRQTLTNIIAFRCYYRQAPIESYLVVILTELSLVLEGPMEVLADHSEAVLEYYEDFKQILLFEIAMEQQQ